MNKGVAIILGIAAFLGGIVVGFIVSPIRNGCGNNNGNTNNFYCNPDDCDGENCECCDDCGEFE